MDEETQCSSEQKEQGEVTNWNEFSGTSDEVVDTDAEVILIASHRDSGWFYETCHPKSMEGDGYSLTRDEWFSHWAAIYAPAKWKGQSNEAAQNI